MLIDVKGCILSGVKLMISTNTYRISLDLPENVNLSDIDQLLRKSLNVNIVPDDAMDKIKKELNDNSSPNNS